MHFSFLVLSAIFPICRVWATETKIRVMTWNVADNGGMEGSFTDAAIDDVLGLSGMDIPSIYAIGLQENCWNCNTQNLAEIGKKFLSRINRKARIKYVVIGIYATRMSRKCELGCKFNTHGTTVLLVIGKVSLGATYSALRQNYGCSSKFIPNEEKGIAAMKIRLKRGKTICFGAGHLDSDKPSYRRRCLKAFFDTADKRPKWSTSCDVQYIFGDFNTRTGDKTEGKSDGKYVPRTTNFTLLKTKDELAGSKPYGTGSDWKSNLLSYMNKVQPKKFQECPFKFMPTYSLKPAKEYCGGKFPCYRTNRPMSWTDRIVHTGGKCLKYDAIYAEYGDHFPVFAEFMLYDYE